MSRARRPDEIDPGFAPRLRDHVTVVPVAEEAILFEEGIGTLHQLSPTAAAVCTLSDGVTDLATLVADASALFDADPARIEADVLAIPGSGAARAPGGPPRGRGGRGCTDTDIGDRARVRSIPCDTVADVVSVSVRVQSPMLVADRRGAAPAAVRTPHRDAQPGALRR